MYVEDIDDDSIDVEVLDFEVFKNEFEVFKCEIEVGCLFVSVVESVDSWFGIEFFDVDESDFGDWEDDWFFVGDEIVV